MTTMRAKGLVVEQKKPQHHCYGLNYSVALGSVFSFFCGVSEFDFVLSLCVSAGSLTAGTGSLYL